MAATLQDKFERLRELLLVPLLEPPTPAERGVLLIYPPDQEIEFRQRLEVFVATLNVQAIAHSIVDVAGLPFACLEEKQLLDNAFRLESENPTGLRRYLASRLPDLLHRKVQESANTLPVGAVILLKNSPALFPWLRFADFLSQLPVGFPCRVVVPFPGRERGADLHFLDQRDGYNYLARRIN